MAHYFTGPGHPVSQGALSLDEWETGLDAYGPRLVPVQEWITRALDGKLRDEVCVTIDDGLREHWLAVPSLERRGLTAAFNVYTAPLIGAPPNLERDRWLRNHGFGSVEGFYACWDARLSDDWKRRLDREADDFRRDYRYLTRDDRRFRYWRTLSAPSDYRAVMDRLHEAAGVAFDAARHFLGPDDLASLVKRGHLIGMHSHTHPLLAGDDEAWRIEWATCRALLSPWLSDTPVAAYSNAEPWGRPIPGATMAWMASIKEASYPWRAPRWSTGYWRTP